jgi:hypothetical protein
LLMNIRETIKKVLKEEIHKDVELIIDKFYNIFNFTNQESSWTFYDDN